MVFCGCCDNSVFDVLDNMSNHINKPNLPTGVRDILLMIEIDGEYCSFKKFDTIGNDGRKLVEWCVDYLILIDNYDDEKNDKLTVWIWEFVYDFLGIKQNSGYDYWLLSILDLYGIMEHGISIRGGWFNSSSNNIYNDREISEERKNIIENWINKQKK